MTCDLSYIEIKDHSDIKCVTVSAIEDDMSNRKCYVRIAQYWYGDYQSPTDARYYAIKMARKIAKSYNTICKFVDLND